MIIEHFNYFDIKLQNLSSYATYIDKVCFSCINTEQNTSKPFSGFAFGTKILQQYSKENADLIFLSVSLEIRPQNHINCSNFLKCFINIYNITLLRTFHSFFNEHQLPNWKTISFGKVKSSHRKYLFIYRSDL